MTCLGDWQLVFSFGLYLRYRARRFGKIRNSPAPDRPLRATPGWDEFDGCPKGSDAKFAGRGMDSLMPSHAACGEQTPSHCKIKEHQCREMILQRQPGPVVFSRFV